MNVARQWWGEMQEELRGISAGGLGGKEVKKDEKASRKSRK